jgi:hypothetical protein
MVQENPRHRTNPTATTCNMANDLAVISALNIASISSHLTLVGTWLCVCPVGMIHHLLRSSHTDNRRLETLCKTWNKIYHEGIVIQAWTSRVCLLSVYTGWSLRAVCLAGKDGYCVCG